MKELQTYIIEQIEKEKLLYYPQDNESFYEDYQNNRCARNGIKPQIYLSNEQLDWLDQHGGIDNYVSFGEFGKGNKYWDIDSVIDCLKKISEDSFDNDDKITSYLWINDLPVYISIHNKKYWCLYAPISLYENQLNIKYNEKY